MEYFSLFFSIFLNLPDSFFFKKTPSSRLWVSFYLNITITFINSKIPQIIMIKTTTVTGSVGTGKTTIAKRLAKKNKAKYIDVNEVIKENNLCTKCQRTNKPVPHHPAASTKVKNGIFPFYICVQHQFLQMMD